jgi:hypothetical protein
MDVRYEEMDGDQGVSIEGSPSLARRRVVVIAHFR